jgi:ribonuclease HI
MQPKQIKFEHQPASNIANGSKTATFRFFDDKNIRVGDTLEVVDKVQRDNPASWQRLGTIQVTEVLEKLVKDLQAGDWVGHEQYDTTEAFLQVMQDYYTTQIGQDTPVKIVRFVFTGYPQKLPFFEEGQQAPMPPEVKLYADGGSRGNPGPSAGGFVVLTMDDQVIKESSKYLGITTNNQAEYHALKGGLELCAQGHVKIVHVFMDSLLVVNQLKGIFNVKNRELWSINEAVKILVTQFEHVNFTHVPRELNRLADAEVNKALDAVKDQNR